MVRLLATAYFLSHLSGSASDGNSIASSLDRSAACGVVVRWSGGDYRRVVFRGEGLRFEFLNSGIIMCLKRVTALPPMETLSPALWTGRRFVMWSGGVGEIRRVVFRSGGLRFEFLNSGIIMCLKE